MVESSSSFAKLLAYPVFATSDIAHNLLPWALSNQIYVNSAISLIDIA